jgi:ankyrin repeat protein
MSSFVSFFKDSISCNNWFNEKPRLNPENTDSEDFTSFSSDDSRSLESISERISAEKSLIMASSSLTTENDLKDPGKFLCVTSSGSTFPSRKIFDLQREKATRSRSSDAIVEVAKEGSIDYLQYVRENLSMLVADFIATKPPFNLNDACKLERAIRIVVKKECDSILTSENKEINEIQKEKIESVFQFYRCFDGVTRLHPKIDKDWSQIVEKLFEAAVSLNQLDWAGSLLNGKGLHLSKKQRIFHWEEATKKWNKLLIELFLKARFDIDTPNLDGSTALFRAYFDGDCNKVAFLIQKGANVNMLDERRVSYLLHAAIHKNSAMAQLFIKHGTDATAFLHACITNNRELIEFFLQNGIDINAADEEGLTALYVAIYDSNETLFKQLIERSNIHVNIPLNLEAGQITPFMLALCKATYDGNELAEKMALALLKKNADFRIIPYKFSPAIMIALWHKKEKLAEEIAKRLTAEEIVTICPVYRHTPQTLAMKFGYQSIAKIFNNKIFIEA